MRISFEEIYNLSQMYRNYNNKLYFFKKKLHFLIIKHLICLAKTFFCNSYHADNQLNKFFLVSLRKRYIILLNSVCFYRLNYSQRGISFNVGTAHSVLYTKTRKQLIINNVWTGLACPSTRDIFVRAGRPRPYSITQQQNT